MGPVPPSPIAQHWLPPHTAKPALQAMLQVEFSQAALPLPGTWHEAHVGPHEVGLLAVHTGGEQLLKPVSHVRLHAPAVHPAVPCGSVLQTVHEAPHALGLSGRHWPLQKLKPWSHCAPHLLFEQVATPKSTGGQELVQLPQCAGSLVVSTHELLQLVSPVAQLVVHMGPASLSLQTCVPLQATVHDPQCWWSLVVSISQPSDALPLQSARPGSHVPTAQLPAMLQVAAACGIEHGVQADAAQPFKGSVAETHWPLQSFLPVWHAASPASAADWPWSDVPTKVSETSASSPAPAGWALSKSTPSSDVQPQAPASEAAAAKAAPPFTRTLPAK
jgi:hypothetical protein